MAAEDYFDDYPDFDYWSQYNDGPPVHLAKPRWAVPTYADDGRFILTLMPRWSWTRGVMKLKKSEINKFYVGAEHIARSIEAGENDSWTHKTEEDAIAHAQKLIEAGRNKTVVVCKIIAIVEKEAPPTKITKL